MTPKKLIAKIDAQTAHVTITETDGVFSASALYSENLRTMRAPQASGAGGIRSKTFVADTEHDVTEQIETFLKTLGADIGSLMPAPETEQWEASYQELLAKAEKSSEQS
jgi:hypothetical protein